LFNLAARHYDGFWMNRFEADDIAFITIAVVSAFVLFAARKPAGCCPRCREHNRNEALFCAQCGLRLPDRWND
jgi:hypothetical protein